MNHGDIKLVYDQLHSMELTADTDEVIIFNATNMLEELANENARLRAALEEVVTHDKYVMHQRCPNCDYMSKGE